MTRVVAVDTSTWLEGIALVEERRSTVSVSENRLEVDDSHSVHLLGRLERLLAEAGWDRSTVDAWVATRGPGSFTGLRVGLGTILGLGLASGRPCIGVGTLDSMAEAFGPAAGDRVPLLDAGREEAYGARFDATSSPPVELDAPWLGSPERATRDATGDAVVFGPGASRYRDRLEAAGWRGAVHTGQVPVAAGAGRLALHRLSSGELSGSEGLAPLYLRPPDAELKRGKA
jgi:tRNA threonylcarbamoyladenosine biosynthesis protein TsaB